MIFNPPVDKFIFDVGQHQSYTHKILTGRASQFKTLRKFGGLSGFQKRSESPYDAYEKRDTLQRLYQQQLEWQWLEI